MGMGMGGQDQVPRDTVAGRHGLEGAESQARGMAQIIHADNMVAQDDDAEDYYDGRYPLERTFR